MESNATPCDPSMQAEPVEYATIARYPGYRFGTDGSAWTCWRKKTGPGNRGKKCMSKEWRQLKPGHSNGYLIIRLCENGGRASGTVGLHSLVCEAFHGPCPDGMECRHFPDGTRSNNRSGNLCWGTRQENHRDMWVQGTKLKGETSPNAKLTEADVIAIRDAHERGESTVSLAQRFNVGRSQIGRIVNKESWAWLQPNAA
jgi:hypothetical protein